MYPYKYTSFYDAQHRFCLDKADVLKEYFTNGTWTLCEVEEYTFLILSGIKFQI